MKIIISLVIVIVALIAILVGVINAALNQKKKTKDLEGIIELKNKTITYLYQNAKEVAEINADKDKKQEELSNAKTDEEVADIITDIINANNSKLRNKNKTQK